MTFALNQPSIQGFPSFQKPRILGYLSINGPQDGQRVYSEDLSQLKYFCNAAMKRVGYDLNAGIKRVIRKPPDLNEKINHILHWILDNRHKIQVGPTAEEGSKPEFVCFRGLLTKICTVPYENRDGWIICAIKLKGVIYMCSYETDEQKQRNANLTERDLQFMSWGFKFEQYMLTDVPNGKPDTSQPVNECEEFACAFYSKLGKNSILYHGEMDGVITDRVVKEGANLNDVKFVELKTSRTVQTYRQDINFRRKTLKWWCQSFLVGIENIICGYRNDQGKIVDLRTLKLSDLPKGAQGLWDASRCMNFGCKFLDYVKGVVVRDYKECVYKFEFQPGRDITLKVMPRSCEFAFLPDWYIREIDALYSKTN